jgi:hypothetical protein
MIRFTRRILAGALAIALIAAAPAPKQILYPSADAAVAALIEASQANDVKKLAAILGPGSDKLINSGDPVADQNARDRFVASFTAKHALVKNDRGETILVIGENDYPTPIPLVEKNGQWRFDSAEGAQEIIDRRIGKNEIGAIRVLLAFVEAQKEFFAKTGAYAQHLVSHEGAQDGLYWEAVNGAPDSPLAALAAQADEEGYPVEITKGKRIPYQGYYFRILKAQGRYAPGGAQSYIVNGKMTGGFALVAWPASYGASGVMTFQVSQDGIAFQKDLGARTDEIAGKMTAFDPDLSWARIDITN